MQDYICTYVSINLNNLSPVRMPTPNQSKQTLRQHGQTISDHKFSHLKCINARNDNYPKALVHF